MIDHVVPPLFQRLGRGARNLDGQIGYSQGVPEPLEREPYRPPRQGAGWLSRRAGAFQSGSVNQYVAHVFTIVPVVLLLRLL